MRNDDLEIETTECPMCAAAGFTAGSEFFDPLVLPHLSKLTKFPQFIWRVHLHATQELQGYFLEVLFALSPPRRGFLQFDGPTNEDAKIAVEQALAEACRGFGLEDA